MNQKKLSIVFVTNNYIPYQGGVVSSITNSMHALRNQGHTVHLITLDFFQLQPSVDHNVIRLYCPIRFTYKTNPMAVPLFPRYHIQELLKKIKPDIIHAHHPFLLGKAGLKAAQNLNIPVIFTYHTLYDHYLHYIPFPETITRPLVNKLVESFCTNVHGIIAPSNAVKERLKACSISTKTEIIPSAIAPIFFQEAQYKKPKKPFHLLSVSRFTKEKNIYFLIDVLASLNSNNFTLTLAGYGSEYSTLQNYTYEYKKLLPKQVRFVEKPTKQQLIKLYQQAHLFIFASTSETQGLVLAEAMAQRIPVIAFNGPGQQDIIQNGYNGFLVNSIYEMKEKIEYSVASQKHYQSMQQHALHTAQNYSSDKIIEKLISFYHTVLAKNRLF